MEQHFSTEIQAANQNLPFDINVVPSSDDEENYNNTTQLHHNAIIGDAVTNCDDNSTLTNIEANQQQQEVTADAASMLQELLASVSPARLKSTRLSNIEIMLPAGSVSYTHL